MIKYNHNNNINNHIYIGRSINLQHRFMSYYNISYLNR
jgi:excinuclease UvrABC nuclease subunit